MARVRSIHHTLALDDRLAECSWQARVVIRDLPTLADRDGRLNDNPRQLKVQLLPYDADVDMDRVLDELAAIGRLERYTAADGRRCIQLSRWAEEQRPHIREAASTIPGKDKVSAEHDPRSVPDTNLAPDQPAGLRSLVLGLGDLGLGDPSGTDHQKGAQPAPVGPAVLKLEAPPSKPINGVTAAANAERTRFMSAYAQRYQAHRQQTYGRPEQREWKHAKDMLAQYGYDRLWVMAERFIVEATTDYPFGGARTITELFQHRRWIEGRLIELRVLPPSAPATQDEPRHTTDDSASLAARSAPVAGRADIAGVEETRRMIAERGYGRNSAPRENRR